MSWDKKVCGTSEGYYYRSRRVAGRAVKQYVGGGAIGRLAADLDRRARLERRARRAARAAGGAEVGRATEPLVALGRTVDLVARAALLLAGYYCHRGGEWRRRGRTAG